MDFEFPINKKIGDFYLKLGKLVKFTLDPFFNFLKKTKKIVREKHD